MNTQANTGFSSSCTGVGASRLGSRFVGVCLLALVLAVGCVSRKPFLRFEPLPESEREPVRPYLIPLEDREQFWAAVAEVR